ncbi:TraR/DksA family transcriptional regulator [Noviherbaspirillum malthae]|jgi:RNA polymerase-binding transcription factor DksA|uniref:TraR/DksA family transcriptional regulator n=1 Tax=Noviherbaspirillum malthae TaxID=1260987 RepID=UPI00188ECE5F|nr:TraR/DksA family transcriptional regulator [Noviherbaspirillum malthae]
MSNLTHEQTAELRKMLDERYAALNDEVHREVNEKDEFIEVASEVPDPGDASFANLAVDLGNAAVTRDLAELRAIEAARGRMENGMYGDCVDCENEIPFERLKVQPTAERCAPCQEQYEKTHADMQRGATL